MSIMSRFRRPSAAQANGTRPPGRPAPQLQLASWTQGVFDIGGAGGRSGIRADGGFGSDADKTASAHWQLAQASRYELEALRRSSWAAKRVTDTIVIDATSKWRTFVSEDDNDDLEQAMALAEKEIGVRGAVRRAWIAARLHGTACILLVTAEDDMTTELVPERIRPGDLKALHVFDLWSMAAVDYDDDWASPEFGKPTAWTITSRFGSQLDVHPSRLLIFHGLPPLTSMGNIVFGSYRGPWAGTSVLESVIRSINSEELASNATAHGLAESAMTAIKSPGLSERAVGDPRIVAERLMELNRMKGLSTILLDEGDEVQRLSAPASGAAPALGALGKRVAWAAGIPEARFLGVPGAGFASSEPEHLAYSEHIRSIQVSTLDPLLERLDVVIARNAGIQSPPDYEWIPLVTLAEAVEVETASLKVDVATKLKAGLANPAEVRQYLREGEPFESILSEEVPNDIEDDDDPAGRPAAAAPADSREGQGDPASDGAG